MLHGFHHMLFCVVEKVANADVDNTCYVDNFYYDSAGTGYALADAYYLVTKSTDAPANSQNLGSLSSGILKQAQYD